MQTIAHACHVSPNSTRFSTFIVVHLFIFSKAHHLKNKEQKQLVLQKRRQQKYFVSSAVLIKTVPEWHCKGITSALFGKEERKQVSE